MPWGFYQHYTDMHFQLVIGEHNVCFATRSNATAILYSFAAPALLMRSPSLSRTTLSLSFCRSGNSGTDSGTGGTAAARTCEWGGSGDGGGFIHPRVTRVQRGGIGRQVVVAAAVVVVALSSC